MIHIINNFIKEYEPIIKLVWAIFPFAVTIIMTYIAYQQYKLVQYKEYCEFKNKIKTDFYNLISDFENDVKKIAKSQEDKKIRKILDLIDTYEPKLNEYEDSFNVDDLKFIKESYKQLKEWFYENDVFICEWHYIKNSLNVIINFVVAIIYAKNVFMETPINKTITLYTLIGALIKNTFKFIIPLFIQNQYKAKIRPFIFKMRAILFVLKFILYYKKNYKTVDTTITETIPKEEINAK